MGAVNTKNDWKPIFGKDIGPTASDRIRSGVSLGVVLVILGITFAAGLVISVIALLGLIEAAAG